MLSKRIPGHEALKISLVNFSGQIPHYDVVSKNCAVWELSFGELSIRNHSRGVYTAAPRLVDIFTHKVRALMIKTSYVIDSTCTNKF